MATATGAKGRAREYAKLGVRRVLYRRGLELATDPYPNRLATTLRWLDVTTVLDVGANIGQYATALRSSGYRGRVLSIEPLTDAFAHLARRSARDAQWQVVHGAVGAEVGTLAINVAANSYASSMLPMGDLENADPEAAFIRREAVDVTTVVDIVATHAVDPARSLLKIDCQGYEGAVLDGTGPLLGRFAAVQLELSFVSLYAGSRSTTRS